MGTLTSNKLTFNQKKVGIFLLDHAIEVILVVLIVYLALSVTGFLTWANWMNIFRANSLKGVIAFGMTMVIIAGLIDLSIGSTVALSGVIVARACRDLTAGGMDLTLACIIGIGISFAIAIAIGWMHGTFSHRAGMPPFIVTLVSLNALYGLAGMISGGFPIANQYPDWFNILGGGRIAIPSFINNLLGVQSIDGIPYPAVVLVIAFLIVYYIMGYTTIGRAIYATGGNPESARLSGINVGRTKTICFIAVQLLAVISGFMTSGQVLAGSFSFGRGWELDVISAVIIGGTSFTGGIGKVWGTFLGVIFMGVISNGMTLLNFDIYTQYVVRGIIMFLAVLISSYRARVKA
ncbi:MAG TPA: ABC transporter permease [Anaerolineaceae bacterium]|nr:ABC transporter permease [Anaerolineaceae bacterium]